MINQKKNISFLIFLVTLIFPCPFFFSLGITGTYFAIILVLLFVMKNLVVSMNNKNLSHLFFCLFSTLLLGSITALHYINIKYVFILMIYIGYSFFFCLVSEYDLDCFTDFASIFLLILEIGALIGFIYAYCGGNPIGKFENIDGRNNYIYLTTFTNARIGTFIRPAGIYDEPGAFGFYIIAVVIMRLHFNKGISGTLLLLLLGTITTSLTYYLCMAILFIPIWKKLNKSQKFITLLMVSLFFIAMFFYFYDLFDELLFQRLEFDASSGTIKGNSRNGQLEGCIESIKDNGALFGNYFLGENCIRLKYGVISECPLSPLALFGVFNSVPYYVFLFVTFSAFILSFRSLHLVAFLLFLQRPYQSSLGYSFFFILFLIYAWRDIYLFLNKHKTILCTIAK